MKQSQPQVIVIGGGHAGCEAAAAAARCGAQTILFTMRSRDLGKMSCNPAIGGVGKGHLVREIDALDGLMAVAADYAGIQYRLLNRSKGPAVQGPRVQADRGLYAEAIRNLLRKLPMLEVREAEVADLIIKSNSIKGVTLADGSSVYARAVVLTTGTFLNGVIHVGAKVSTGGRVGDNASLALAKRLYDLGLPMGRLKTGTPPRLDSKSIDWSRLEMQVGDATPVMCSFLSTGPRVQQVSCGITYTNQRTHALIEENLHKSALFGGQIKGVGPRYCPSIEDKVTRFADKTRHQIFLEPEGLDCDVVYPNGISTSLPAQVQTDFVRSIEGLEDARILKPGYAIEYDFIHPTALSNSLMLQEISGLYLAGQINGTTGYEEAAAQGLVAGLNAAAKALESFQFTLGREQAYIGVMIDDLTTQGVSEPYRMFTSRSEYRLTLRADNADQRLTAIGRDFGCVSESRWRFFDSKREDLSRARSVLEGARLSARELAAHGWKLSRDGMARSGLEALAIVGGSLDELIEIIPQIGVFEKDILEQLAREALYSNYVVRQERDIETLRRDGAWKIPASFDYAALDGLSLELRQKLSLVRPETLAQAGRVDGMTPVGMALVLAGLRQLSLKAVG